MRIGGEGLHWIVGYFIMAIGGYYGKYGDDVELAPLDPILYPVPDCLTQLNPFPVNNAGAAAGLDYSGKFGLSSEKRRRPQLMWEESLFCRSHSLHLRRQRRRGLHRPVLQICGRLGRMGGLRDYGRGEGIRRLRQLRVLGFGHGRRVQFWHGLLVVCRNDGEWASLWLFA